MEDLRIWQIQKQHSTNVFCAINGSRTAKDEKWGSWFWGAHERLGEADAYVGNGDITRPLCSRQRRGQLAQPDRAELGAPSWLRHLVLAMSRTWPASWRWRKDSHSGQGTARAAVGLPCESITTPIGNYKRSGTATSSDGSQGTVRGGQGGEPVRTWRPGLSLSQLSPADGDGQGTHAGEDHSHTTGGFHKRKTTEVTGGDLCVLCDKEDCVICCNERQRDQSIKGLNIIRIRLE